MRSKITITVEEWRLRRVLALAERGLKRETAPPQHYRTAIISLKGCISHVCKQVDKWIMNRKIKFGDPRTGIIMRCPNPKCKSTDIRKLKGLPGSMVCNDCFSVFSPSAKSK